MRIAVAVGVDCAASSMSFESRFMARVPKGPTKHFNSHELVRLVD